jgi:predicted phosphodiesterase
VTIADDLKAVPGPAKRRKENKELIESLEAQGYRVTLDKPNERQVPLEAPIEGKVRFGVVSDTHLGHKNQQLTHLHDFYDRAKDWGAQFMLHGGDLVDGQNMHRDQQFELFKHGVDAQANYAIENFPKLVSKRGKTLPTYVIGGNHDGSGWNDVGANVLRQLDDGRDDITFLGAPTATFHHGPLRIMLMHPDGGGGYARSYKLQKIVEGFEANTKPHILFAGHWHIQCHVNVRNVDAFAMPCFQSQTAYIKRKGLQPVIGGLLVEAGYSERGLEELATKWVFYRTPVVGDF